MRRWRTRCCGMPAMPGGAAGFGALSEGRRDQGAMMAGGGATPLGRLALLAACLLVALVGLAPVLAQAQDPVLSIYRPGSPTQVSNVNVAEGDHTVMFTVSLDRAATKDVTVAWATADGTATAGTDYEAVSGTLMFKRGELSKTVSVSVKEDDVDEPLLETFTVQLSNPSGATIGMGTGTVRITDDDDPPIFADGPYEVDTPYRQTTVVDLASYLAPGVDAEGVAFAVACDADRGDYYSSVDVSGAALSLVSNELGHTHGSQTREETECQVTATASGGGEETRTFLFRIGPPRAPRNAPEVVLAGRHADALELRVREPLGRVRSWMRLSWREAGTDAWTHRILSGAMLHAMSPPPIRVGGLGAGGTYEFRAAVLTRHAFDHYAQGRAIPERTLTPFAQGLDGKWIRNLPYSGQSPPGSAEGTTDLPTLSIHLCCFVPLISTVNIEEGFDVTFTVSLDHTATEAVTVDWETSDGTAKAGTDYDGEERQPDVQPGAVQQDGVGDGEGRRCGRAVAGDVHGGAVERCRARR